MMDIGEVLSHAWKITWKYKILWLFGILASCGSGGGGGGNGGGGNGGNSSSLFYAKDNLFQAGELWTVWANLWNAPTRWLDDASPWLILFFVCLGIVVALVLIMLAITLSTVGRIGLIQGTTQADAGAERLGFIELFKSGQPYFWRVLFLSLIIVVCAVAAALLILVPVGIFTCGVGFLLFLPFAWFVAVWIEQASAAVVVDDLSITDGMREGWEVIRDNLGIVLVMSLILYLLLGLLAGLILALPVVVLLMPLALGGAIATATETSLIADGGLIITLALLAVYIPFAILIGGVIRTYVGSAWTLTYLKLSKGANVAG